MAEHGSPQRLPASPPGSAWEVLAAAGRLGMTSFGGPVAHIGYFRNEYVVRRKWLDEPTFADLVALTQTLPGPASSQLGIAIGILRAGLPGGLAAWAGFTLPSAAALTAFALAIGAAGPGIIDWLGGLKLVAIAVIAQALWGMAKSLTPDAPRATIALAAAIATLIWPPILPAALSQVSIIVVAGLVGWRLLPTAAIELSSHVKVPIGRNVAVAAGGLLVLLLLGLPAARAVLPTPGLALADSFFRVGALVFGGGHVVLPLLEAEVVPQWITPEQFLVGYGAAQAVPGPLFTFAAYLGALAAVPPGGAIGAALASAAIFLPGGLMVVATLPSWGALRGRAGLQSALRGINAAVVGLLLAGLYQSGWAPSVKSPADFALILAAFGLLTVWKLPPWIVVGVIAVAGAALTLTRG